MDDQPPYQLSQKIDYLYSRVSSVHSEVRRNNDIELRLNFQQFIDLAIRQIMTIKQYNTQPKKPIHESNNKNAQKNDQKERYEFEKKLMELQIRELNHKQLEMQIETLTLKIANLQTQYFKLQETRKAEKRQLMETISRGNQKNRYLEQEIQMLAKLNQKQEQQIKTIREQRNRAQKLQLEMQQKYNTQMGKLQKYQQKHPKFIDRSSSHLKCYRTLTNSSPLPTPACKKLVTLPLPLTLQVSKLVYGIMLGIHVNQKQVMYYDKLQLYEKEVTRIEREQDWLVVSYKRRKENVRVVLDKYVVRVPEIVLMLGGRGDSVIVHQEPDA